LIIVKQRITNSTRRLAGIAAAAIVAVALLIWLADYLLVGQYFVSTDDAYIAADSAMIAPKISGYIVSVLVKDNQAVRQGQILAVIDDRDYQAALASAKADVAAGQASLQADQAMLSLQDAKIQSAQAMVMADQAKLAFAGQNSRRYAAASASGASTAQSSSQANTEKATAQAALDADKANLLAAQRQVDVLNAQAAQAQASLEQARARADQATLNLGHTEITAPFDGMVADKTVAVGDYLTPGTELMGIVPLTQVYVMANYKETQITHLAPGQKVRIAVDGFPGLKVTGIVDSVAPASGQEFALLPPDNATGNFTKIVQRVPVKIDIALDADLIGKLRPGMSVEPDIDTRRSAPN
jgi:membrane fusion protein (multidrug efflux system)